MLLFRPLFESCVNSRYSKTIIPKNSMIIVFESCVNSRYSKTSDLMKAEEYSLRAV